MCDLLGTDLVAKFPRSLFRQGREEPGQGGLGEQAEGLLAGLVQAPQAEQGQGLLVELDRHGLGRHLLSRIR
jgi:hypothetical protein